MAVSGGCARSEGRIWWANTEDRWPRKYRRRLAVDVEQQRRKKSSSAAAQEEADLDGMQNGQVAEGGRIGMGWGCAVEEARRTYSRAGQGMAGKATYRTGLDWTGLDIPYWYVPVHTVERNQARGCCRSAVTG
jgi:hypothetical protein